MSSRFKNLETEQNGMVSPNSYKVEGSEFKKVNGRGGAARSYSIKTGT